MGLGEYSQFSDIIAKTFARVTIDIVTILVMLLTFVCLPRLNIDNVLLRKWIENASYALHGFYY